MVVTSAVVVDRSVTVVMSLAVTVVVSVVPEQVRKMNEKTLRYAKMAGTTMPSLSSTEVANRKILNPFQSNDLIPGSLTKR